MLKVVRAFEDVYRARIAAIQRSIRDSVLPLTESPDLDVSVTRIERVLDDLAVCIDRLHFFDD